jgi:hypothetical protein
MHDATRPAFGRVRAPKSRSVTRLLRTKLGRLGHHRPDNRVCEEAGLSRDDVAPLRLASCGEDETASADPARAASTTVKADVSSRSPASPARLRSRPGACAPANTGGRKRLAPPASAFVGATSAALAGGFACQQQRSGLFGRAIASASWTPALLERPNNPNQRGAVARVGRVP